MSLRGHASLHSRNALTTTGGTEIVRLPDPNDEATWEWSDNAALCILDYLTHPDGYGRSRDDVDIASFIAKADIDDEAVALAAGGTEPRYRLWYAGNKVLEGSGLSGLDYCHIDGYMPVAIPLMVWKVSPSVPMRQRLRRRSSIARSSGT